MKFEKGLFEITFLALLIVFKNFCRYFVPTIDFNQPLINYQWWPLSSLRHGAASLYARICSSQWPQLMSVTLPRLISQLAFYSNTDEKETLILRRLPSDVLHPAVRSIQLEDAYWRELCTKITGKLFPHLSSTAGQVLNVILRPEVSTRLCLSDFQFLRLLLTESFG